MPTSRRRTRRTFYLARRNKNTFVLSCAGDRLRTTTGFVIRQPMRCLVAGHNGHRASYGRSAAQLVASDEGPVPDTAGSAARVAVVRPAGRAQAHALRRQMSDQRLRTAAHHRHTHTRPVRRPRVQVYTQGAWRARVMIAIASYTISVFKNEHHRIFIVNTRVV